MLFREYTTRSNLFNYDINVSIDNQTRKDLMLIKKELESLNFKISLDKIYFYYKKNNNDTVITLMELLFN